MYLTEEEAKQKWCPESMQVVANDNAEILNLASYNRIQKLESNVQYRPAGCHCIASDCMMWREGPRNERENIEETVGYCGLAGRPE